VGGVCERDRYSFSTDCDLSGDEEIPAKIGGKNLDKAGSVTVEILFRFGYSTISGAVFPTRQTRIRVRLEQETLGNGLLVDTCNLL